MNNKIMKEGLTIQVLITFFLLIVSELHAQELPISTYGLPYINSISLFEKSLMNHPEKQMVSLSKMPGIILDLRYATPDNFMHKNLYPTGTKTTFLRKRVSQALDSVSRELSRLGILLVIFDAYRPYSVTEELWKQVKDDRYASNPSKGSGHNRGIAVDLALADSKTRQLLTMPTGFDNFSDSASQDFKGLDAIRNANRELLKESMERFGFIALSTEWWHFSWPHPENFEVLDLSFQQLAEVSER